MQESSNKVYEATLDFLYHQLPMFSRIGAAAVKKNLDNITALCAALGNPQDKIKTIHIAGTNGKGSVSHMLAAIFQQAGYKTGLYTSPHLVDFRERIRIDGQTISQEFVVEFVERNRTLIERIQPSFFEITVAMAFQAFAAEQVAIAIIETGLGGRLDSTNIIHPELSIITNISMDHTDMLGNTLAAIAKEKAGIIKPGTPVVLGQYNEETFPVFAEQAEQAGTTILEAWKRWKLYRIGMRKKKTDRYVATDKYDQDTAFFESDLRGGYQVENMATVFTAVEVLEKQGWAVSVPKSIPILRNAAANSGLRGRWEVLKKFPLIVADVAHNPAGLGQVFKQWNRIKANNFKVVIGFVKDKDVRTALAQLNPGNEYYFCAAKIPRALPADELATMAHEMGFQGSAYPSVAEAVNAATNNLDRKDALLITGSFFVVGEALQCYSS